MPWLAYRSVFMSSSPSIMFGSISDRSMSGTRFLKISSAARGLSMTSRHPWYDAARKSRTAFGRSPSVLSPATIDIEYVSKPCWLQGMRARLSLPTAFSQNGWPVV